jgi:hypothetical protein
MIVSWVVFCWLMTSQQQERTLKWQFVVCGTKEQFQRLWFGLGNDHHVSKAVESEVAGREIHLLQGTKKNRLCC